ncbi:hypothetical protein FEM48_Zijuj06G0059600 [Ziziphus jujuba var. spinosa]|uniref:Chalcone isomerase domain-containing protein n=1 Tax=Ziziphus jujuba var. spinosa TaxID=714518 RepID=A0A978V7K2_ZIZJJ|nr:hypothetical protein FEM48_Zijuj06G0059600 [Ziziphus jujuba var. spinosa]
MRNNWFWFMDLDGGSPYILPMEPLTSYGLGGHLFSQLSSFVDNSFYHSSYLSVPGSLAVEGAFSHISKLAGALLFLFSSGSSSNIRREIVGSPRGSKPRILKSSSHFRQITSSRQNFKGLHFSFRSNGKYTIPVIDKISSFLLKLFHVEAEKLQLYPMLSLAAALVPPFDNISSKVLAVPLENTDVMIQRQCCEVEHQGCAGLSFPDLNWRRHAVEPRTGIEFPMILDNILAGESNSRLTSEILVGTGSRTMTIIKIKSLNVYAFGFYIHPSSVCEKLGRKYASVSAAELNKCQGFYEDLLREDINMTVRLVVSCNGMKINSVKDAFEKSLRARLLKTNPETNFHCIRTFGSFFTQDIPLPAGTIIDFRRTAEGQLITERAFFGMYIGDVPVSEQTKQEIGENVASLIRRC